MRRFLPIALIALLVAGCGSVQKKSSDGGSIPAGASLVRADVLAFASVNSGLGSSQWQTFSKLWEKFPSHDTWLQQIEQSLSKQHLDYARDVAPALGSEVDVGVAASGTAQAVVGLTKPDNPAKFKALVAKSDQQGSKTSVTRDLGNGWWGVADKASDFDAVVKGTGGALSGVDSFTTAMAKLPGDTLVRAYVDGAQLNQLAKQRKSNSGSGAAAAGLEGLKYAGISLAAEDSGLHLQGVSSGGNLGGQEFASKLLSGIPSDSFLALDVLGTGVTQELQKLETSPHYGAAAKQLEQQLGVTPDELVALLDGEVAFYARPGTLIPEFTLALKPNDATAALSTVDKVMAHLAAKSGTTVQTGTDGKTVDFGGYAIHYGERDGKVIVSSGLNGISDFGSNGSVTDSADFKEAKDAAGMPDSTGGIFYLDLKDAIPLIEGFASMSGHQISTKVSDNLKPLRSLLSWSQGGSNDRTFDAFLEIK
jgi:Protein of unknown function (DUF3352)